MLAAYTPVSYTHLDVYKRQAYCTLAAGTTIGKKIDGEGYKIISNTSELKIVKENYYRELGNDAIVYPVDSINNR